MARRPAGPPGFKFRRIRDRRPDGYLHLPGRCPSLAEALQAIEGPTIVAVECGNVNTGGFDDFAAVADLADEHRARGNPTWVHVDGAVMLLAASSPAIAGRT